MDVNWTCTDSVVAAFVGGVIAACLVLAYLLRRKPDGPGVE